MVFLKKSTFSLSVLLSKESQKETFFDQLDRKVKFSQSRKKSTFCKGVSPWFLSKNWPFSHMLFFSKKKGRKKHFLIFWIEKNAFQTWKVKFLKSRKNRAFPHLFFISKNGQSEFFFLIFWKEKNAF